MHGKIHRSRFGFDRLVAPVTPNDFLTTHYEASPLVLHRGDPTYYAELLSLDAVWGHIETRCPRLGSINLVKLGEGPNLPDWLGPNGRADPVRVAAMFNDGWTVALNKMHDHLPALGDLCASAEAEFSCPFQTNLYLTPPDAQGFKPHWDTHDVFVLQVHGSKEWTLYDTKIELPLVGQSFDDEKPLPGPISAKFTLHAGDLLYCPRGLMHSAASSSDTSLHITLGVMGRTWSELLVEALCKMALEEPALRRNLPNGYARSEFDLEAAATEFHQLVANLIERADFFGPLADMRDSFVTTRTVRRQGLSGQLARLDQIGPRSRAAVRPDLVWHLQAGDGEIHLTCGSSLLTLPDFVEAAVRIALMPRAFTIIDLPGPLDEAGRVTLVRRLVREGILEVI